MALKRAAKYGDGWIAANGDIEFFKKTIARITELRKEYGRDHEPFHVMAMTHEAFSPDGIKRLEEVGVNEVVVAFRDVYESEPDNKSIEEKISMLKWYKDNVIEPAKAL